MQVNFYNMNDVDSDLLKYAVIVSKHKNKWIYVKHKERNTWEIPGGRRELGEDILTTARRELVEETGAIDFIVSPVCIYSVDRDGEQSYGILCYSEVESFSDKLEHEITEIKFFDHQPEALTYPMIQPYLHKRILKYLNKDYS